MRERADALAHTTVLESGKPLVQARGEWMVSADLFEWFAEEGKRAYGRTIPSRVGTRRLTVLKQPIGVVGIITAWNFPAYNVARAGAAALAAGCTVVHPPVRVHAADGDGDGHVLVEAALPRRRRQPGERRGRSDGAGDARSSGAARRSTSPAACASASC